MAGKEDNPHVPPEALTAAHEIERAKRLGTYKRIDRSRQYDGRYSPEMLLRGVDHAHKNIREIEQQKFRYAIIVAVVSFFLSNAPAIVRWMTHLFR